MGTGIRAWILKRALATFTAAFIAAIVTIVPAPQPARAAGLTGSSSHPPPSFGAFAYYATFGAFGPSHSGFPGVGQSFVDPVFGSTIRRLTNELGHFSESEIYSKNGYYNADGSLVHHRSPSGHDIIRTSTGQVVRSGVAFNYDSSFAPDDPDAWYHFAKGDTTLYKYSVSTGTRTAVNVFPGALGDLGGSVDWIDRTGRYMVLRIAGVTRVYDKATDTLYAGSIPSGYGANGGWVGISPDGNYVITSTPPTSSQSWKINHTTKTVSTTPVTFWTLCGGHGDLVSASNGKTYFVTFDCHTTGSVYAADVSLPQSAGNVSQQLGQNRKLVQLSSWADVDGHFSGVSKGALQDWVFVSIESGDDGFLSLLTGWRPYKQEIMMTNVVTGAVRRLAHHRSRGLSSSYFAQPRVNASWTGNVVGWTSNFGYSSNGYADLYVMPISGASTDTTTAPTVTNPPTTSSPTLAAAFTNPSSGTTVSGTVTVSVAASGGSGYTYTVKAGASTIYSGTNGSFSWNTTGTPNGAVTLTATVKTSSGTSASTTRSVTVSNTSTSTSSGTADTTRPTVTITTPTTNVWTGNSIEVGARASDNKALRKIEIWGGGKVVATFPCSGTSCSGSTWWITGPLAAAAYQVHAVAVDTAGNRTVSAARLIYKDATSPFVASGAGTSSTATTTAPTTGTGDTTLPSAFIISPTSGVWTGNSINISALATDNVRVSSIKLYGNGALFGTIPCGSTFCTGTIMWLTGSLPSGSHTVKAVATDSSGNTRTSATVTIYK